MRRIRFAPAALLTALVIFVVAPLARADEQQIAPGTGLQSSVVINTGADGICNTAPAGEVLAHEIREHDDDEHERDEKDGGAHAVRRGGVVDRDSRRRWS